MENILLFEINWSSILLWVLFASAIVTAALSYKDLFTENFISFLASQNRRDKIIFIVSLITLTSTQFKSCIDDKATTKEKKVFQDTLTNRDSRYNNSINSLNATYQKTQDSLKDIIGKKTDTLRVQQLSTKDTIIAAIDNSYQHSISASSKALAGFGITLQDSLRTIKVNSVEHTLLLAPIATHETIFLDSVDGKLALKVQLKAYHGSVFNVNLRYLILYRLDSLYAKTIQQSFFPVDLQIGAENISTFPIEITPVMQTLNYLTFVIKGSYTSENDDKAAQQQFYLSFEFDIKKNMSYNPNYLDRKYFKDF